MFVSQIRQIKPAAQKTQPEAGNAGFQADGTAARFKGTARFF